MNEVTPKKLKQFLINQSVFQDFALILLPHVHHHNFFQEDEEVTIFIAYYNK